MSSYRSLCCLILTISLHRTQAANPEIVVPNVVIEAEEGSTAELVWNYTDIPDVILERWVRAETGAPVALRNPNGETKIFLDRAELFGTVSIRIRDLTKDDTGFYELHTIYADGKLASRAVELIVAYGPSSMDIVVHPYPSYEGNNINLTCYADSRPPSNYTWERETGDLPTDRMTFDPHTGVLSIRNATREDVDKYKCTAGNGVGYSVREFTDLELWYSPRSTSLQADPGWAWREGDTVTLRCTTDAFPPATFTWRREDDGIIPEEPRVEQNRLAGTLIFNGIEKSDVGTYVCEAANGIGQLDSAKFVIDQVLEPLPGVVDNMGQSGTGDNPATRGNVVQPIGGSTHVTSSILLYLAAMLFSLTVCRL
ncbi:lachesin-like [Branchiostoma floridae]|uniref:Lachesin-like n=1 Tax=Branchiostoma floridae TaxID=7739 RepID=A0A9J7MFK2_BRAFL|nr:lachesin-like [Branchiostoma floridae]